MSMTTATTRTRPTKTANPVRTSHRRFGPVRTRVLEVGPRNPSTAKRKTARTRTRFVLFHGYCDNADTWRRLLKEFADSGHSAIAVDLPGFGEADPLNDGPILPQLDEFVANVVVDQARYGQVVLVGNSLGGTESLRAAQNPDLPIAGVMSIAAPGFSDSWLVRTVRRNPLPLRAFTRLPFPVPDAVVQRVADGVVPYLIASSIKSAEADDIKRFRDLFNTYSDTSARLKQANQLCEEFIGCYEPDRIKTPLLVVACGKDKLVRAAGGKRLHTLVPHSRLFLRPDWGHCPQLDHPDEIHRLVTFFAASCDHKERTTPARARKRVPRPRSAAS